MRTVLDDPAHLDNDTMLALAELLGIQTLPLVLDVAHRHESVEAWTHAHAVAQQRLAQSGLVDEEDEVAPALAEAMHILARPDRELVMRAYDESGVRRVCLARRGFGHALAVRTGAQIVVGTAWADEGGASLARLLLAVLGAAPAAEVGNVSAPAQALADALDRGAEIGDYAHELYGLGVEDRTAVAFGLTISKCRTRAEIVAYAHENGVTAKSSGAVAVYDTENGRVVASPRVSPDGSVWCTFSPGSDHRVAEAISNLVEALPGGRWMP